MNALERRISKIESKVLDKKHPGVFIIIRNNDLYIISNYEEKGKAFNNVINLQDYIFNKYNSDKYIFIYI